jgi:NTE family protein
MTAPAGSDTNLEIRSADVLTGPVHAAPGDGREPTDGVALCLSGGGYRAMLFHVGVLWRLNETGWLARLDRVSSVSGGSITAATLGVAWPDLGFTAEGVAAGFERRVVAPVRALAGHTVDIRAAVLGALTPQSIAEKVADAYREHLFGDRTLQDLPDHPAFVVNATNLASGVLFRFSKAYLGDWRVGRVLRPTVDLAAAVAASSAFPPFLAPYRLDLRDATWVDEPGNTLTGPEFRGDLHLCDGGVYDNLGLETAWKRCRTVLVSDAGAALAAQAAPHDDWALQTVRVLQTIDDQVRALRTRQVVAGFESGTRTGMYAGIRTVLPGSGGVRHLPASGARTRALAAVPTRLRRLDAATVESLVNWGYVAADAGLRRRLEPDAPLGRLPYPDHPLT